MLIRALILLTDLVYTAMLRFYSRDRLLREYAAWSLALIDAQESGDHHGARAAGDLLSMVSDEITRREVA